MGYLNAIGRAIYKRGVDIEIVLSNPESVPNDLIPLEAIYGNGWSCVDVAAEIIKAIQRQFPKADVPYLRRMVQENLRVTFLRTHSSSEVYGGQGADRETMQNSLLLTTASSIS